jgi:FAD/FMN-containing dehydrogenase
VRAVDPDSNTMIAEAGVTLDEVRAAADAVDRLFPLKLASGGSCDIGGNVSTNAGGTEVLAYGNMRELVLGAEVVLASGAVWDGLRTLRKDNTGYDLKHLFIGAEGTLGVVTAAVLTLVPKPRGVAVAFIGLRDPATALKLFHLARARAGKSLTAFEIVPRVGLEFVLRHAPGTRDPLAASHPWYVLMEYSSARDQEDADAAAEAIFAAGLEAELVDDGALAQSLEQAAAFWHLREMMSEVQKLEGGSIKHDVAVPLARVPELIARASAAVAEMIPGVRPCPFGHMGDGNIHFNVSQPPGMECDAFMACAPEVHRIVYGIVGEMGGSISAEHGIGYMKVAENARFKPDVEMDLMRAVKRALDPEGLMNPGKVIGN